MSTNSNQIAAFDWPRKSGRALLVGFAGQHGSNASTVSDAQPNFLVVEKIVKPALRTVYPTLTVEGVDYGLDWPTQQEVKAALATKCRMAANYDVLVLFLDTHGVTEAFFREETAYDSPADLYTTRYFYDMANRPEIENAANELAQAVAGGRASTQFIFGSSFAVTPSPNFKPGQPISVNVNGKLITVSPESSGDAIERKIRKATNTRRQNAMHEYAEIMIHRYIVFEAAPKGFGRGAAAQTQSANAGSAARTEQCSSQKILFSRLVDQAVKGKNKETKFMYRKYGNTTFQACYDPHMQPGSCIALFINGDKKVIAPKEEALQATESLNPANMSDFVADLRTGYVEKFVMDALYPLVKLHASHGMTGQDFHDILSVVPNTPVVMIVSSCYSGSLLNDPVSNLPNVVALLTSSSSNELTHPRPRGDRDRDLPGAGYFCTEFFQKVKQGQSTLGSAFLHAQRTCDTNSAQALFRQTSGQLAISGQTVRST